jgi:hypothetical protein
LYMYSRLIHLGYIFFFFVRRWKRICFTPFQPPTVGWLESTTYPI